MKILRVTFSHDEEADKSEAEPEGISHIPEKKKEKLTKLKSKKN
jgi:hypothetical protein